MSSIGVAFLAVVGAVLLAFTSMTTVQYTLTAATYILPGLFGYPFSDQASRDLATSYIGGTLGSSDTPAVDTAPPSSSTVLYFPWPLPPADRLPSESVIFAYSEGAIAAMIYKRTLNQDFANNGGVAPDIRYVLIGNQNRPNGGSMARMSLGATPTQSAGADPNQTTTYDIVRQYDAVADYPTNPLNFLSVANAAAAFVLVHMDYFSVDMSEAVLQGTYGDTEYYLIPTHTLPLLMPLEVIPVFGPILADTFDPVLRVLVEAGYDRTTNPGVPTPFNLLYSPDPAALAENLQLAFLTGLDNGLEDLGMSRPFETVRPGPYGVGGPPVTLPDDPPETTTAAISEAPPVQSTSTMTASTDSTGDAALSSIELATDQTVGNVTDTEAHSTTESTNPESTPETTRPPSPSIEPTSGHTVGNITDPESHSGTTKSSSPGSTPETTGELSSSIEPTAEPEQSTVFGQIGENAGLEESIHPVKKPPGNSTKPDDFGEGTTAGTRHNGESTSSTSSSRPEATSS